MFHATPLRRYVICLLVFQTINHVFRVCLRRFPSKLIAFFFRCAVAPSRETCISRHAATSLRKDWRKACNDVSPFPDVALIITFLLDLHNVIRLPSLVEEGEVGSVKADNRHKVPTFNGLDPVGFGHALRLRRPKEDVYRAILVLEGVLEAVL